MEKFISEISSLKEGINAFEIQDIHIIVIVFNNSVVSVLSGLCSHMNLPLDEGTIEDGLIECPFHGAKFDINTGDALSLPATKPLRKFNFSIKGNALYVEI